MTITAKFASTCPTCGQQIQPGTKIEWSKGEKARHTSCTVAAVRQPVARRPAYRTPRDHEDCLSVGPCGPNCEYAHIFRRR